MVVAIVPAYNEAKRIGTVVTQLCTVVDCVVVVDDASNDSSARVAQEAGAVVLRHNLNRGQGAALETGHVYARNIGATYVVHFDGDGQFDVADIAPAIAALKAAQADILFGSRFLKDNISIPWLKRKLLLPLARIVDSIFGAVPRSDVHNGFRILSARALQHIIITQDRMAHATQIPQLVRKHQLSYIEHPVTVTYHEYGQSSMAGFRIIADLLFKS